MLVLILCSIFLTGINAVTYDCYTMEPITTERMAIYTERNASSYCTIEVQECDPNGWKKTDGSCNNLKKPNMGMARTPTLRLLPTVFSTDYEPRKAVSGKDLHSARYLRLKHMPEGNNIDAETTQLVAYYLMFLTHDIITLQDILNYLGNTTSCCQPDAASNYICSPILFEEDDPIHRYSGYKCQNLTKPQSFQYYGCADFGTTPFARIVHTTPFFDLSDVYGEEDGVINKLRTFTNGTLKVEIENGKVFPPGDPNIDPTTNACGANILPKETRCHLYQQNAAINNQIIMIAFYRQHNNIAQKLTAMNPCWDEERVFNTAVDINMAIHSQILYYELFPILLGRSNMIRDGLISHDRGFRNVYDENVYPQSSEEFIYMLRWFHMMQNGDLDLYDTLGNYLETVALVDTVSKTGEFPYEMEKYYQGSFRQCGGAFNNIMSYDMAERCLGTVQKAFDVAAADLYKGRFFGMQGYVQYRRNFTGRPYKSFDDLKDVMSDDSIALFKEIYDSIEDLDLMAGTWNEKYMANARVPHTLYYILADQIKRNMVADRFWYESSTRPHAFTLDQLEAIRDVKLAGVLCTNADGITEIQPNAFYTISAANPLMSCESPEVGTLNLSPWKDSQCNAS